MKRRDRDKKARLSILMPQRHPTIIGDQRAMLGIDTPQHVKLSLILEEAKCLRQ